MSTAHAGDCEGFPYYSSNRGKHLFRPVGHNPDLKQWLLSSTLNPRDNQCDIYVECADPLPLLGARTWKVWSHAMGRWESCELQLVEEGQAARIAATRRQQEQERNRRVQLEAYARDIGIDPAAEPQLMWIAEKGFVSPLPPGWKERVDTLTGVIRYQEIFRNGQVREHMVHPMAGSFRDMADRTRLEHAAGSTSGASGFNRAISGGGSGFGGSIETPAEDVQRRDQRRLLAAEGAVAMGFPAGLVASVQAEGQFDDLDALVEKLAELTQGLPEREREEAKMMNFVLKMMSLH